jgi:hypothetical protein
LNTWLGFYIVAQTGMYRTVMLHCPLGVFCVCDGTTGNLPLLATAGDDGFVRLWRLADIWQVAAVAASPLEQSHQQQHQQQGPAALAALQLPHVHNALGLSNGSQPAGQSLVIDQQHQQLFVGEFCSAGVAMLSR